MPDLIESSQTTTSKRKNTRPDGVDQERYRNLERWSYRKWAWQFLRRNDDFIKACKKAERSDSDDERQAVADRFGLKKFKSYRESYRGDSGKPAFAIGSVTAWINRNVAEVDPKRRVPVTLDSGQVLIRFDLASAVADPKVLQKQLRSAERRLLKFQGEYAQARGRPAATKSITHKVSLFGQYLRLLDSRAAGRLQIDSGLLIAPRKAKRLDSKHLPTSRSELAPAISKKMARAIEYTTDLYRFLAALDGRPNVKSIPLEE